MSRKIAFIRMEPWPPANDSMAQVLRNLSNYQNATMNFSRSSNITRSIIEQYGCQPEKVVYVYAGSNAKVNPAATGHRDYEGKNILFVGMDWRRKGGPELVEAFKTVLKVHPDAKLTVVGEV